MLTAQRVAVQRSLNKHGRCCQAIRRLSGVEKDAFISLSNHLGCRRISQAVDNAGKSRGTMTMEDRMAHTLGILQKVLKPGQYEAWSNVVRKLSSTEPGQKRRRIGVLAIDDASRAKEKFIEAVVGDAFPDQEVRDAIEGRWAALPSSTKRLTIRHGDKVARFGPVLEIPSKILESLDVEIVEIRDARHAPELLRADLPIIITDKKDKSFPSYLHTVLNPLILEGGADGNIVLSGQGTSRLQIAPKNTDLVTSLFKERLPISKRETIEQQRIAIRSMIEECNVTLDASKKELHLVKTRAISLKAKVDGVLEQLRRQYDAIDVSRELQENKRLLGESFDGFQWYKIWDLDDLGERLSWTVTMGYGTTIERRLEWFAGLMGASQQRITELASEYLEEIPDTLPTATLKNRIQQIDAASSSVVASSFTGPVVNRRRQLAETATQHLQSRFLRRVYASLLAMPVAVGTPAMSWANQVLDLSLAAPTGAIALLLCIRHISKGWEKGRRKWWADYDRIELGLEDDIRLVVKNTLETRVMLIPQMAIEESALLVSQQELIKQELAEEVATLEER